MSLTQLLHWNSEMFSRLFLFFWISYKTRVSFVRFHASVSNFLFAIEAEKDRKQPKHGIVKALDIEKLLINQCSDGRNILSRPLSLPIMRGGHRLAARPAIYNFSVINIFSLWFCNFMCEREKNKQKQGTKHVQMFAQLKHVAVFLLLLFQFNSRMSHLPVFENF